MASTLAEAISLADASPLTGDDEGIPVIWPANHRQPQMAVIPIPTFASNYLET